MSGNDCVETYVHYVAPDPEFLPFGCSSAPNSPYTVTCPAVTPAALHLSEAGDAALLPAETAAWTVNEVYTRLWVYCEVEEETHHLSVGQNTGLGWTWREDDETKG